MIPAIPRPHASRVLLLLALAVTGAIGCTIAGGGGTWTITPAGSTPDIAPTGEFTDPDTGKTYELWDTDGDGKADYIRDEDGKTYRVEPMLPKSLVGPGGPHAGAAVPVGARAWWDTWLNPPAVPMPVVFDKSAAEYLHEHGLDALVPGQSAVLNSGLTVNDVDPDTLAVDLTLAWSTGLGLPDILDFPSLQYEFYELSDRGQDFGQYLSLRVVGPFADVALWLSAFGVEEVKLETEQGPFELYLDADNGTMLVLLAGHVLYDGPLG
jgi:hypothetical protein